MLGVGILGAGFFGAFHARAIATLPDVRVVAVCAEELALAEAFAAEHGGKPFGDWRAMLDDASVDVVVITAPHHLHCELAVAALAAASMCCWKSRWRCRLPNAAASWRQRRPAGAN